MDQKRLELLSNSVQDCRFACLSYWPTKKTLEAREGVEPHVPLRPTLFSEERFRRPMSGTRAKKLAGARGRMKPLALHNPAQSRSAPDEPRPGKARRKDEGGRMKGLLFSIEAFIFNSILFILHPSAFRLALPTRPLPQAVLTCDS